jgi:hypothetical protein
MKNSNLHRNILVNSILCFGSLTGLAGAAVYFDPTLMNNWIGPAILGVPPAIGLIFYLIARSWTKGITLSLDTEKAVEPEEEEITTISITKSPNHQITKFLMPLRSL